jgi:predicted nuclease with TOPRIM domain
MFLYIENEIFFFQRNHTLTKENTTLKQRLDSAEEKLNALQRVNEVSWRIFKSNFKIKTLYFYQTIHDEFQALQLAYTQLEKRQQELDASNAFLRREMTEKLEKHCNVLDEEVQLHQKFVLLIPTKTFQIILIL